MWDSDVFAKAFIIWIVFVVVVCIGLWEALKFLFSHVHLIWK